MLAVTTGAALFWIALAILVIAWRVIAARRTDRRIEREDQIRFRQMRDRRDR